MIKIKIEKDNKPIEIKESRFNDITSLESKVKQILSICREQINYLRDN